MKGSAALLEMSKDRLMPRIEILDGGDRGFRFGRDQQAVHALAAEQLDAAVIETQKRLLAKSVPSPRGERARLNGLNVT